MSCGILVPHLGIEQGPSAVTVWSLNHWPAGKVPFFLFLLAGVWNRGQMQTPFRCRTCSITIIPLNGKELPKPWPEPCEYSNSVCSIHGPSLIKKRGAFGAMFIILNTWPLNIRKLDTRIMSWVGLIHSQTWHEHLGILWHCRRKKQIKTQNFTHTFPGQWLLCTAPLALTNQLKCMK